MASPSRDQKAAVPRTGISRRIVETGNEPDIYADEFWIACGPFGCTLTLLTGMPSNPIQVGQETPEAVSKVVGRVRMSPQLAADLARLIQQQVTATVAAPQSGTELKH
jgi:hypothetical protein